MNEFDNQEANGAASPDELDDLAVEISDLSPDKRSHYALLRLRSMRGSLRPGTRRTSNSDDQDTREARQRKQAENDDFEIEFSDLPPSQRSHYLLLKLMALRDLMRAALSGRRPTGATAGAARPTRAQRRESVGRMLTALGLCATILLLLAGNVPSLRSRLVGFFGQPTPAPTQLIADTSNFFSSSSNVDINVRRSNLAPVQANGSLGALPSTCPKANILQPFEAPLDPPGVGGGPIWLVGFSGPTASLVHLNSAQEKWLGWYQTLTLFVAKGYENALVLQGGNQVDGAPLWFGDKSMTTISNSIYFNMQQATDARRFQISGQWGFVPINVFVPAAGCYFLQAKWPGSSWTIDFAAGHL